MQWMQNKFAGRCEPFAKRAVASGFNKKSLRAFDC